jgi:hypothetical protein
MHVLSTPIQYIKLRRAHKKQKRIALHMLAVSGVLRPSYIELRYEAPITSMMSASHGHTAITGQPLTHPLPLPSWDHNIAPNVKQTPQWGRSLSSAIVQLAKEPILFPWAKQLDL